MQPQVSTMAHSAGRSEMGSAARGRGRSPHMSPAVSSEQPWEDPGQWTEQGLRSVWRGLESAFPVQMFTGGSTRTSVSSSLQ